MFNRLLISIEPAIGDRMRGGEREIISFGQVSVSHGKQVARGGRDQTHSLGIMTSSPQDSGARWRGRVRISPLIRGGTTLKSAESGSGSQRGRSHIRQKHTPRLYAGRESSCGLSAACERHMWLRSIERCSSLTFGFTTFVTAL